ncbi:hypothetical protein ACFWJE_32480 [Streptomyces griseoincarnatus]
MSGLEIAASAGRAVGQAARLTQSTSNPYVMVKHGRREDRAAVYDRYIAACAGAFHDASLDREGTTELLVALMAVRMRAPKEVRVAAAILFDRLVGLNGLDAKWWFQESDQPVASPEDREAAAEDMEAQLAEAEWVEGQPVVRQEAGSEEPALPGLMGISSNWEFLMVLSDFTDIARADVRARWWHPVVMPWRASWWPLKRHRRETAGHRESAGGGGQQ